MPANEVRYEFDDVYAPDSKGYTLGVREIFFLKKKIYKSIIDFAQRITANLIDRPQQW